MQAEEILGEGPEHRRLQPVEERVVLVHQYTHAYGCHDEADQDGSHAGEDDRDAYRARHVT
ncbi:hypothetical protein [Rugosimonospora africana]|uniref:Uncharacterized protein n=1 Tax=Rugosimonospora africana TaxID=556532 RepID=A0A8J3QYN8_9ACTN|nr:hypothetical protein [Rugosimonospora africana]GIH17076.1 hypothetical protein Raf01_52480 [Rugosimonospora africana]